MAGELPVGTVHQTITKVEDSPIGVLPPELLAEIFDRYAVHDSFSPILLSHVSAFWRHTAITTPRLWWSISATLPSLTPDTTSAKVRTWLTRSGSFPLHISLVVTEWSDERFALTLLNDLRKHSSHWRRFTLTAGSYHIARRLFVYFTSTPHHEMLSRIDFSMDVSPDEFFFGETTDESENAREDIIIVFSAIHAVAARAAHFTDLNIESSALPYYASWGAIPRPELSHLRTLRILDRGGHLGHIDGPAVLHVLTKCPALEVFFFRGWHVSEPGSDHVDIVHLPNLRELHIAQTFHQHTILSHLSIPSLEILRLSWLNRPDAIVNELYEPDSSEEDEALVEYSQSPYTDILTGVGLRSLIKRCAPPIRMVDMDFADARSPKDFVWLFAHLPTLETFRISGSDMSDKVLWALASPQRDGAWLSPKLTSLDFSRCHMITGNGVLALANGRNPPVDCDLDPTVGKDEGTAEGRSRPARLTHLIVDACAMVDCESVALKQYLLDEVDFEVEVMPSQRIFPEDLNMPE